jgi:hypothetical protein
MSRKDYVALAEAIRLEFQADPHNRGVYYVAQNIAAVLAADNPNFNKERFLEAALGSIRDHALGEQV